MQGEIEDMRVFVAVIADQQLVPVRHRRDALGHGEGGAGGHALDAEPLGHAEPVLDVRVFHTVLHVVAEQGDTDAGVVELPGDGLPRLGVGRGAPDGRDHTFTGLSFQMSRVYSRMVRSLENLPMRAVLRMAIFAHFAGSR